MVFNIYISVSEKLLTKLEEDKLKDYQLNLAENSLTWTNTVSCANTASGKT